jgi:4a-hydroxytetrahydrobiopterin dehydratase
MAAPRLTADEIAARLAGLGDWTFTDDALHARHDAPDVPAATRIVTEVFRIAEEMNHHPDADLRWKRVHWRLTTHDSGGVTALDVELAGRISEIAAAAGATPMAAP